jgi:hypothetical protein
VGPDSRRPHSATQRAAWPRGWRACSWARLAWTRSSTPVGSATSFPAMACPSHRLRSWSRVRRSVRLRSCTRSARRTRSRPGSVASKTVSGTGRVEIGYVVRSQQDWPLDTRQGVLSVIWRMHAAPCTIFFGLLGAPALGTTTCRSSGSGHRSPGIRWVGPAAETAGPDLVRSYPVGSAPPATGRVGRSPGPGSFLSSSTPGALATMPGRFVTASSPSESSESRT